MKKISILFLMLMCFSCTNDIKWEYKTVKVAGKELEVLSDFNSLEFDNQETMLNSMGKERWELVNVYTEVATAHPNYGNSDYVTGIRENTRTSVLNFVFKRPLLEEINK